MIEEVKQPDGDVRKLLDVVQSDMLRNLANMTNPCAAVHKPPIIELQGYW